MATVFDRLLAHRPRGEDLALLARDIAGELGEAWLDPFFTDYGHAPDPEKLEFFRLLDEFF